MNHQIAQPTPQRRPLLAPDGYPWNYDAEGKLRPLVDECYLGFRGQLVTDSFEELRDYCRKQPRSTKLSVMILRQALLAAPHRPNVYCRTITSYGLKHLAERISDEFGQHEYVSNEEIIIDLVQHMFKAVNAAPRGCKLLPNYHFDISTPLIKAMVATDHPVAAADKKLKQGGYLQFQAAKLFREQQPA